MKTSLQAVMAILLAIFSLQLGASFAKSLFPVLGAAGTTSLRIFFAAVILLLLFRPWREKLDKKSRKFIAFYGISIGLMNLCFYKALETLPQGVTVALEFTGPLTLSLCQSQKRRDFFWAVLAAIGIYLLMPFHNANTFSVRGVFYALSAGAFWALYIHYGQKAGNSSFGIKSIAWGMCLASLITLPLGIYETGEKLLELKVFPTVLGVALLSSVIPYSLEISALKKVSTKTFGILMSLEPAVAALVALSFLNEKINFFQFLAIAFICIASFGATFMSKTR